MDNSKERKENKSPYQYKQNRHRHGKKPYHQKDPVPTWTIENRGAELPDTKLDLMTVLEELNPDELLMTSLVQQSKAMKILKTKVGNSEVEHSEGDDPILETPKVTINLSQNCPICEKPIREIMYALHDYEHDQLAHFDCVYKKVLLSVKDKLVDQKYLVYLGSGSFGIMAPSTSKQPITLVEKIYPGAPLEEMLHGDELKNSLDEEI
ncbi:MAG: hypothetical protein ACRCWI_03445 [Brevinema sp.]